MRAATSTPMRKAHDVALSDIDAMRLAIEHDGAHLNDLQTEIELADLEGSGLLRTTANSWSSCSDATAGSASATR